jgi:DNA-binding CsgD family transcriptional regulator
MKERIIFTGNLNGTHHDAQEDSITHLFYEGIPIMDMLSMGEEDEKMYGCQVEILNRISAISDGSLYAIDLWKRCFLVVSNHDLFLSGTSPEDVLKMGYDFFQKIVCPADLQLFIDIYRIILQRLFNPECKYRDIDYFAFNFRLLNEGKSLMVYHKMLPMFINDQARWIICHLSSSVKQNSGNLEIHYQSGREYASYSFERQQWQEKKMPKLTDREKDILKLTKQGKCGKEIANILCISHGTLRNIELTIYRKLDVHSMIEAVIYATNHRMVFI